MSLASKNVMPYMGVTDDFIKELADGRKFRVILYGAYNAMGLIGPEFNGIAILNEHDKNVVTDNIGIAESGYFGPTKYQLDIMARIKESSDAGFVLMVNESSRRRYTI